MKTIGIVGGLGPEATVDYYNEIINSFKNESADLFYPEIIIYSVNMSEFIGLMREKKYDQAMEKILEKTDALKRAGAVFAAITANTPHMFFDILKQRCNLPLISIVEATRDICVKNGYKRAGLLGTGFTMDASFYPDVFSRTGIEVIMPETDDRKIINTKLFSEIEIGIFRDDTRQILIDIIEKMVREQHIDCIILGCTELPLILKEPEYAGVPSLNTTKIHVDAIVEYCLSE
ncbi:MAG TPA: amino acid racemase [Bacteroidales bacterium]|nr:amino acid racemase [Bacteroidales bacterium]